LTNSKSGVSQEEISEMGAIHSRQSSASTSNAVSFSAADLREAVRARNRAIAVHFYDPNVKVIDVGLRLKDGRITDELTVRAHVVKKVRGEAFETLSRAAPKRVIDEDRIGFPVDIIQSSYLQGLAGWPAPLPLSRVGVVNPLCGGVSISNERDFNSGTLGGIVADVETGGRMILSNWHVLVGSAYAPQQMNIFQPGRLDGGSPTNVIARLNRHAIDQGIDAAVADLTDQRRGVNNQVDLGPVNGVDEPVLGMSVTKSGRTTAITTGMVTGVEGVKKIYYGGFPLPIKYVAHIAQDAYGGQVSAGGDSGSWWLDASTKNAVGLHFAGSDDPEYALMISMPQVLDALQVRIITGA
jgi:hypothetical protein